MAWKEAALKHAKEEYPSEACGLLCVIKGREKYWPCKNLSDIPTEGFLIDPDDWIKAEDSGELIAVVHSHPDVPPTPSEVDKASCEYIDLPFYIVNPDTEGWHYFEPSGYKAPLIGRQWTWGSADCWTIVIDWFEDKGLEVKDWKRPKRPEDILTNGIFERLIPQSGFVKLSDDAETLVGDLFLHRFNGQDPDHVSIYIGCNTVLHHMGGRLSSRDQLSAFLIESTVGRYRYAQED